MRRLASQLHVSIAAFDVTTRRTRSAGCKRCNALVKVDHYYYYYYYYTGEDYSDTVTSNAAGALYKIKLNT